jgi:hypothetical protein
MQGLLRHIAGFTAKNQTIANLIFLLQKIFAGCLPCLMLHLDDSDDATSWSTEAVAQADSQHVLLSQPK